MTQHVPPWWQTLAAEAEVWVADPDRAYLPNPGLTAFANYAVPTTLDWKIAWSGR